MTLSLKLNRITPQFCRVLARCKGKPASNAVLAKRSGLSSATIVKISKLERWDSLTLRTISLFTEACGVNLLRLRRDRTMDHIANAKPSQRKMIQRILEPKLAHLHD